MTTKSKAKAPAKTETKKVEAPANVMTLGEIAGKLRLDPKLARRKLRAGDGYPKPVKKGRWEWTKAQAPKVQAFLKQAKAS